MFNNKYNRRLKCRMRKKCEKCEKNAKKYNIKIL